MPEPIEEITPNNINLALLYKLMDISQHMAETRALDPLLHYAIGVAIDLVGAERGYLVLLDKQGTIDFRVKRDSNGHDVTDADDQISRTVLDRVFASGEPVLLRNAVDSSRFGDSQSVQRLQLRSVMCVPLIARQKTIGAIYVENRSRAGRFAKDDLTPLAYFANQSAVFVENAILNDGLESLVAARTAELEQAMARLEQSWSEAVDFNHLQTTMLANVAHDIRSPLSIASTSLAMMHDGDFGDLNEEQIQWMETAMRGVNQSIKLTEDLFLFTVKEAKGIELVKEDIDFVEFLSKIHQIGKALPWHKGVTFDFQMQGNPTSIALDPHRIQQVLLNLLSNSLKFTEHGTVILYGAFSEGADHVVIGVKDTGSGIPETMLDKIFERFQQVEDGSGRTRYGTGLGLAICRDLVEMHGGQIWAESKPAAGSNFTFTIPFKDQV